LYWPIRATYTFRSADTFRCIFYAITITLSLRQYIFLLYWVITVDYASHYWHGMIAIIFAQSHSHYYFAITDYTRPLLLIGGCCHWLSFITYLLLAITIDIVFITFISFIFFHTPLLILLNSFLLSLLLILRILSLHCHYIIAFIGHYYGHYGHYIRVDTRPYFRYGCQPYFSLATGWLRWPMISRYTASWFWHYYFIAPCRHAPPDADWWYA